LTVPGGGGKGGCVNRMGKRKNRGQKTGVFGSEETKAVGEGKKYKLRLQASRLPEKTSRLKTRRRDIELDIRQATS